MSWAVVRRWVATMSVAVLVAAGCATAAVWQWHRHEARSAAVEVLLQNQDAPAVELADLLSDAAPVGPDQVWHAVSATGHYVPGSTVLLRNRPVGGAQGFHALAGFAVDEGPLAGSVLVVDRGWIPTGADGATARTVPDLPAGSVALVARLRVEERANDRTAPPGQVQVINGETVRLAAAEPWDAPTLPAYATVVSENGEPSGLDALETPSTDLGSHLSYAFQWSVFALGSLGGAVVLLRREAAEASPGAAPARRRRRPSAEEEEDALLDAQEAASRE